MTWSLTDISATNRVVVQDTGTTDTDLSGLDTATFSNVGITYTEYLGRTASDTSYVVVNFPTSVRVIVRGNLTLDPNLNRLVFQRQTPNGGNPNLHIDDSGVFRAEASMNRGNAIRGLTNADLDAIRYSPNNLFIEMTRGTLNWPNTPDGGGSLIGDDTEGDINISGEVRWEGFQMNTAGSLQVQTSAEGFITDVNHFIYDQSANNAQDDRGVIQQDYSDNANFTYTRYANNTGEYLFGRQIQVNGFQRSGGIYAVTINGKAVGQSVSRDANNDGTLGDFNGYLFGASNLPNLVQLNWQYANQLPRSITNGGGNAGTRQYLYQTFHELYINATDLDGDPVNNARYFIRDTDNGNRVSRNGNNNTADRTYDIRTSSTGQVGSVNGINFNNGTTTVYDDATLDPRVEVVTTITNVNASEALVNNGVVASLSNTTSPNQVIDVRTKGADPVADGYLMDVPAWHYDFQPAANTDIVMSGVGGTTINNTFLPDNDVTLTETQAAALVTRVTLSGTDVGTTAVRNIRIDNDMTLDELYDLLKYLKVNESSYFEFPTASTSIATNAGSGYLALSNINITQTVGGNLTRGTRFTGLRLTTANTFFDAVNNAIDFNIDATIRNPRVFLNLQIPAPADRATNFSFSGVVDGTLEVDYPSDGNSTNNIVFNAFMSTGLTVTSQDATDNGNVTLAGNAFGDLIGNAAITIDPDEANRINLEQIPAGVSQVVIDLSETSLGDHIHVFRIVNNVYQVIADQISSGTSSLTYTNTTFSDIETNPIRILWNNRGTRTNYQILSAPTIVAGETNTNTFSLSALSPLPTNPPVTPSGGFANPASITFQPALRTGVNQQILQVLDTNAGAVTEKIHPEITATIADRRAAVGDATNNYLAGLARLISAGVAGTPNPTDGGSALNYDTVLPGASGADMINAVMFFQQGTGTAIGNIEVLDSVVLTNNAQNFNTDNLDSVQQRIPTNIQLSTEATEQVRFGKRAVAATVDDVTTAVNATETDVIAAINSSETDVIAAVNAQAGGTDFNAAERTRILQGADAARNNLIKPVV